MGDDGPRPSDAGPARPAEPRATRPTDDPLHPYIAPAMPPTTAAPSRFAPARAPPPPSPPTAAHFLRRLSYVLSLVVGTGALLGLIWGKLVLPMLHATFSARRALAEAQVGRWEALVVRLKSVSRAAVYDTTDCKEDEGELAKAKDTDTDGDADKGRATHRAAALLPLDRAGELATSLRALGLALQATQTTRTSLLSTLESYTSNLHRSVFLRAHPAMGANFAFGLTGREREKMEGDGNEQGAEWDAARREVRAIKGLLLGRRSFATAVA